MTDDLREKAEAATPDIVAMLRSPSNVFYEYAADNGDMLTKAADEITALRAKVKAQAEALRPFARAWQNIANLKDGDAILRSLTLGQLGRVCGVDVSGGDYRRAAQEASDE